MPPETMEVPACACRAGRIPCNMSCASLAAAHSHIHCNANRAPGSTVRAIRTDSAAAAAPPRNLGPSRWKPPVGRGGVPREVRAHGGANIALTGRFQSGCKVKEAVTIAQGKGEGKRGLPVAQCQCGASHKMPIPLRRQPVPVGQQPNRLLDVLRVQLATRRDTNSRGCGRSPPTRHGKHSIVLSNSLRAS